ncbi:heat shock factor protein-like isoform X1 [Paramacrobiotus metropolitanus]|uniref:heat shock factor protein-like isoform X1 n=1 Tax=Paramacrobiotus metropolitanus TaxID=2943436 RepID=UPI002445B8E9|nr:heat shock factor protein-like isoform X1 [Paramacrobiotus metropolitanus]
MARTQNGIPLFLAKLWRMVNDPATDNLISWSADGNSFIVPDRDSFARKLLPQYYKHNKWNSFVRVLNMYGFRKEISVESSGLQSGRDDEEYKHPCFRRDSEHLLASIKRTHSSGQNAGRLAGVASSMALENGLPANSLQAIRAGSAVAGVQEEQVSRVLNDVRTLRSKQESTDAKLDSLKRDNERLWTEMQDLRAKHQHQQNVVNKLIQFFVTLLQNTGNLASTLRAPAPQLAIQSLTAETQNPPTKRRRLASDSNATIPVENGDHPTGSEDYEGPIIRDVTDAWTAAYNQQTPVQVDWDRLLTNVGNGQILNGLRNAANASTSALQPGEQQPLLAGIAAHPVLQPSRQVTSSPAVNLLGSVAAPVGGGLTATPTLSEKSLSPPLISSILPVSAPHHAPHDNNAAVLHMLLSNLLKSLPGPVHDSSALAGAVQPVVNTNTAAGQPVILATLPTAPLVVPSNQQMAVQPRNQAGPLVLPPNTTVLSLPLGSLLQLVQQQQQQQQPPAPVATAPGLVSVGVPTQRPEYTIQYPDSPMSAPSPAPSITMTNVGSGGQLLPGYGASTSATAPIQSSEMAQQIDTVQSGLDSIRDTLASPGFTQLMDLDQLLQLFSEPEPESNTVTIPGHNEGLQGVHDGELLETHPEDLLGDYAFPSGDIEGVTIQIPAYQEDGGATATTEIPLVSQSPLGGKSVGAAKRKRRN